MPQKQGAVKQQGQWERAVVAQNRGSVVLFWVPTLKEAVPPPPPPGGVCVGKGVEMEGVRGLAGCDWRGREEGEEEGGGVNKGMRCGLGVKWVTG